MRRAARSALEVGDAMCAHARGGGERLLRQACRQTIPAQEFPEARPILNGHQQIRAFGTPHPRAGRG